MKNILWLLVLILFFGVGYQMASPKSFVNPYPVLCKMVSEKIYLTEEVIADWKKTCLKRSELVQPTSRKDEVLADMNKLLESLQVSHLEVYDPAAVKAIWQGERSENGIESQFVDGELVIFQVYPESPAATAGLRFGDVIRKINNDQPNPWEANSVQGKFEISRGIEIFEKELVPTVVKRQESIHTTSLKNSTLYMKVPTFRAEYFANDKIEQLKSQLRDKKKVILDLRGNLGGNFVAGTRLASLFLCAETTLGYLKKPRSKSIEVAVMPDDLNDRVQIQTLEKVAKVELKTSANPECFKGSLRVLVDGRSASVSELVAQALKEVSGAKVEGSPSSGQMLVGLWYSFDELSPGVQISIPEAVYVSPKNYQIEGVGVQIDRSLSYDLREMQAGIDSWVKNSLD